MPYTNDHREMPPKGPTFQTHGKHGDNVSKIIKTNNCKDKISDKPHSTPLPPRSPRITNQSQWTSTGQELQGGTGEDGVKDSLGEMLLELITLEPKEGCRVHASAVDNKDTSLTIAPQNRSTPIPRQLNS